MPDRIRGRLVTALIVSLGLCWTSSGCKHSQIVVPPDSQIARELSKTSMPTYVIEPPDILIIEAIRTVPKPPYKIEALDTLHVQISGLPPTEPPIDQPFQVDTEGSLTIGIYGKIKVVGKSLDETKALIEKLLKDPPNNVKDPKAFVQLVQSQAVQQIQGEHLVSPDGSVNLKRYGSVYVAGMTRAQAKTAIEQHLAAHLQNPEISIDVQAYNSKVYYVIFDGGGFGQQVTPLPITGNETVLDAIGQLQGLPQQASRRRIWVARPRPATGPDGQCLGDQILPVDWDAITMCGRTDTNYQLFPGDRVYVKADALIAMDNFISKLTAPFERMFGFTLIGNSTVRSVGGQRGGGRGGIGTGFGGGFGGGF